MHKLEIPTEDGRDVKWITVYAKTLTIYENFIECDLRGDIEIVDTDGEWVKEYVVEVWVTSLDNVLGIQLGFSNKYKHYYISLPVPFKDNTIFWFYNQKDAALFYKKLRKYLNYPIN
jgi:hypothetical protein